MYDFRIHMNTRKRLKIVFFSGIDTLRSTYIIHLIQRYFNLIKKSFVKRCFDGFKQDNTVYI